MSSEMHRIIAVVRSMHLTVSFIRYMSIMQNLTRIEVEISKMIDTLIQK